MPFRWPLPDAEAQTRMSTPQNTKLGIWLMIATTVVFAAQDGISRHLGMARQPGPGTSRYLPERRNSLRGPSGGGAA